MARTFRTIPPVMLFMYHPDKLPELINTFGRDKAARKHAKPFELHSEVWGPKGKQFRKKYLVRMARRADKDIIRREAF